MTIRKSAESESDAADRRGDDTHWWKAYQLHSTVALAMKARSMPPAPGAASRLFANHAHFRPAETEIHRAAKKALGSVQLPSAQVDPASD